SADEVLSQLTEFLGIVYTDPRLSAVGIPSPPTPRPSAVSIASVKDQVAERVAQLAPALGRAREASRPAIDYLKTPMTVRGATFPRWIPAAALFGFALVLVLLLTAPGDEEVVAETQIGNAGETPPADPDVPRDTNPE